MDAPVVCMSAIRSWAAAAAVLSVLLPLETPHSHLLKVLTVNCCFSFSSRVPHLMFQFTVCAARVTGPCINNALKQDVYMFTECKSYNNNNNTGSNTVVFTFIHLIIITQNKVVQWNVKEFTWFFNVHEDYVNHLKSQNLHKHIKCFSHGVMLWPIFKFQYPVLVCF